jgi:hypothetical protein
MSNWKELVGAVAPGLATALGGPLMGGAVAVLANKLLGGSTGDPVTDEAKIAGILANGITPEVRLRLAEAENAFRLEMRKVDASVETEYLRDVQDARKTHGSNADILTLGVVILLVWALLTGATLTGLYLMLTGGIKVEDVGIVATVFTVLGSTIGYVSNIAQQVVGYYYGSSRGSTQKNELLSGAVTSVGKR